MKIGGKTKVSKEITRQERNRRNNMKRITISAVAALLLFIALTVIQSSILNQEEKITVYQFKKDITTGTKITSDNIGDYLGTYAVQISLIPNGYITDQSLILDKFVTRNYKAKDILTVDGLKETSISSHSDIERPIKLSFSIDGLSNSVSGILREGDYINIYAMRNQYNDKQEVISKVSDYYTFMHVYIETACDSSGNVIDSADTTSDATLFTVIIEEDDAELFYEMVSNCSLKLVKIMYNTNEGYKAFKK